MHRCVYVCVCVSCVSRLSGACASASLRFFVCAATDRPNRRERLAERNWILIGKTRARQEANVNSPSLLLALLASLPTFGCSFGCCCRVVLQLLFWWSRGANFKQAMQSLNAVLSLACLLLSFSLVFVPSKPSLSPADRNIMLSYL